MKATLEFKLPEDQDQFTLAKNGATWRQVVYDLDELWLRSCLKYGHKFTHPDEALQACRDQLHASMAAHGVSLEEVS